MKDLDRHKKIAVLIDADNAQRHKLKSILEEISAHGHIITKRAYGDWSRDHLKNWKDTLNELAIQPTQQFAYTTGKNASDILMIIDAMDLLYTEKYDAFALVSSDSDFTALASRLKNAEILVFGVGENKTPVSFKNACNNFILTENLGRQDEAGEAATEDLQQQDETGKTVTENIPKQTQTKKTANRKNPAPEPVQLFLLAWEKTQGDDDWINLSAATNYIKRIKPDFNPKNYGTSKMSNLITQHSEYFTIKKPKGGGFYYKPKKPSNT